MASHLGAHGEVSAKPARQSKGQRATSDALKHVPKDTIRARVYSELKRAILSGAFEPGEAVVVRVVAEQMDVGVMPVRESIQQLVTEGALEFLPNRTVRVPMLNDEDLREIYEIRKVLEGLAAARAATRMTKRDIKQLERLLPVAAHSREGAAPSVRQEADLAFHFVIYEAAEAPHLFNIIETLWLKVGPLLILPFRSNTPAASSFFESLELHSALIQAMADKDPDAAQSLMARIIQHALDWHLIYSLPQSEAEPT